MPRSTSWRTRRRPTSFTPLSRTIRTTPDPTGDRGTSVAGIVAAVDSNGRGGRGVAPGAVLRGVNYLKSRSHDSLVTSLGGQDETTNDLDIAVLSFSDRFLDDYRADTHRPVRVGDGPAEV